MLKFSKRFAVFLFSIFVLILGLYFFWTNNHYDRKIFLSGEGATKNWGINANIVFFEYSDENFYIEFDSNYNIKSAKKKAFFGYEIILTVLHRTKKLTIFVRQKLMILCIFSA